MAVDAGGKFYGHQWNHQGVKAKDCTRYDRSCVKGHRHHSSFDLALVYQLQSRQCQRLNFLLYVCIQVKKMIKRGKKVCKDLFQSQTKTKESYRISHGLLGCRSCFRPGGQKHDPPLAGGAAPKQHVYRITKHPPSANKCPWAGNWILVHSRRYVLQLTLTSGRQDKKAGPSTQGSIQNQVSQPLPFPCTMCCRPRRLTWRGGHTSKSYSLGLNSSSTCGYVLPGALCAVKCWNVNVQQINKP